MIRILEGRVGSGKTSLVLDEIAAAALAGERALWLVPEHMTLQAELMLTQRMDAPGFLLAEVLSPTRLLTRTLEAAGGLAGHTVIDERGRALALRACLAQMKDKLAFYGGCSGQAGFIEWLVMLTGELARNEISPTDLRLCADSLEDDSLQMKLYDIAALLDRYGDMLNGRYLDIGGAMTLFRERVGFVEFVRDARCWVDGFDVMPPRTLRQIVALAACAREVTIAMTLPPGNAGEDGLFEAVQQSRDRLRLYAGQAGVPIRSEPLKRREYNSREISHLETNWDVYSPEAFLQVPKDISLTAAANPGGEAEYCAGKCLALARDEGMRFGQIAVVAGDLEGYAPLLSREFAARNIPCFLSRGYPSSNHPAARYWLSAMEAATTGMRREAVLRALRSGFSGVDEDEADMLSNLQFTRDLRGRRWERVIEGDEAAETARGRFIKPLLAFQKRIKDAKSTRDMARAAYSLLDEAGVYARLVEEMDELERAGHPDAAQHNAQIWREITNTLDQSVELMGDGQIPFAHLLMALRTALESGRLSALPPHPDAVLITDIAHVKGSGIKVLFVLGLNDGLIPASAVTGELLSGRERALVNQTAKTLNIDAKLNSDPERDQVERFTVYSAFTLPTHRLLLSYALADEAGGARMPSTLIQHLRSIFINLRAFKPDDFAYDTPEYALRNAAARVLRSRGEDETALSVWHSLSAEKRHEAEADAIRGKFLERDGENTLAADTALALSGNETRMGITRLERYAACPYQHFAQYMLRPLEIYPPGVRPLDAGLFFHDALEEFVRNVRDSALWADMSGEDCLRRFDEAAVPVLGPLLEKQEQTPRLDARVRELMHKARMSARVIAAQLRASRFLPIGQEIEFGVNKPYPAFSLMLKDGNVIRLEGRIDRVDLCTVGDKKYIRVIDYKSGVKDFRLRDVEAGLALQLPIYARVSEQALDASAAGFFYFGMRNRLLDGPKEDAVRELMNEHKLKGMLLSDIDIARAMDTDLSKNSNILPVRIKNDGGFHSNSPVLSQDEMGGVLDLAVNTASALAQRMRGGDIHPAPARIDKRNFVCVYCAYASICKYKPVAKHQDDDGND